MLTSIHRRAGGEWCHHRGSRHETWDPANHRVKSSSDVRSRCFDIGQFKPHDQSTGQKEQQEKQHKGVESGLVVGETRESVLQPRHDDGPNDSPRQARHSTDQDHDHDDQGELTGETAVNHCAHEVGKEASG